MNIFKLEFPASRAAYLEINYITKRQRAAALQNLAEGLDAHRWRASVLECASPLAL